MTALRGNCARRSFVIISGSSSSQISSSVSRAAFDCLSSGVPVLTLPLCLLNTHSAASEKPGKYCANKGAKTAQVIIEERGFVLWS